MARAAFGALALLLATMPAAAAEPTAGQRSYVAALNAFDSGEYARAAGLFRTALTEDSNEGLSKFVASSGSLNRVDYFPHLYLGLSLAKSGSAKEAIRELEESRRQGAVLTKPGLSRILDTTLRRLQPAPEATKAADLVATVPTPIPVPAAPTRTPLSVVLSSVPSPVPPVRTVVSVPTRPVTMVSEAKDKDKTHRPLRKDVAEGGRDGLRLFFAGDFGGAEKRLSPLVDSLPVARLFLAYSLASEALLAGQATGAQARSARDEYRRAQEAGAPRSTDALVSPAVRRLLAAE
ncbi:MAG: hypothetical protein ABIT01_12320 [Thermoanaerobaculia bacterium]